MLRITIATGPNGETIILEGRLAGSWVDELGACWRGLITTREARSIRIELDAVTFIDAAGKTLLRVLHAQGAVLAATEIMTRAIVDEIVRAQKGQRTRDR